VVVPIGVSSRALRLFFANFAVKGSCSCASRKTLTAKGARKSRKVREENSDRAITGPCDTFEEAATGRAVRIPDSAGFGHSRRPGSPASSYFPADPRQRGGEVGAIGDLLAPVGGIATGAAFEVTLIAPPALIARTT
jgi:hypothetical protein